MEFGNRSPADRVARRLTQTSDGGWRVVLRRVGRVLRYDGTVYADLRDDPAALRQAARVVGIVAAAAAISTLVITGWQFGSIIGAILTAVIHWLAGTGLTYLIATLIFQSSTTMRRLLNALGYSQAPQVVAFFGFVPVIGPWVVLLSRLASIIPGIQAMQATIDLDRRRMLATNLLALVISLALSTLFKAWLGDVGPWEALTRP